MEGRRSPLEYPQRAPIDSPDRPAYIAGVTPDELQRRVAKLGELARAAGERLAALDREVASLRSVIDELEPSGAADADAGGNPTTETEVAQAEVLSK